MRVSASRCRPPCPHQRPPAAALAHSTPPAPYCSVTTGIRPSNVLVALLTVPLNGCPGAGGVEKALPVMSARLESLTATAPGTNAAFAGCPAARL